MPYALAVELEFPAEPLLKVTVPGPLTLLQSPFPIDGVFPPREPESKPQTESVLAVTLATVGVCENVTVTSADVAGHTPLLIVQRNTYVPYVLTVTVELPKEPLLNVAVPGPLTRLHAPLPTAGVFPPSEPETSSHTESVLELTLAVVGVW